MVFEVDFFQAGQEFATETSSGTVEVAVVNVTEDSVVVMAAEPAMSDSPTTPESPPSAAESTTNDTQEDEVSEELREASLNLARISLQLAKAQAAVKRLKKQHDLCIESLQEIAEVEVGFEGDSDSELGGESNAQLPSPAPSEQIAEPTPLPEKVSRDEWRSVKISALQEFGLKENRVEKLIEAGIETIGQLEDRRALICEGKEKWPKGIGEAKITEIENAVVGWLAKYYESDEGSAGEISVSEDPDLAATEEQASDQPAVSDVPSVSDPNEREAAQTPKEPKAKKAKKQPPDTESVSVTERAQQIDNGEVDCLDSKHEDGDGRYWDSGFDAFGRDVKLDECPYVPGTEQDEWIRGWLAHKCVDNYEPKSETKAATVVSDITEEL